MSTVSPCEVPEGDFFYHVVFVRANIFAIFFKIRFEVFDKRFRFSFYFSIFFHKPPKIEPISLDFSGKDSKLFFNFYKNEN